AQGLLDQVKAGQDFAEVARKSSEDPGSAAQGGSLGCFGRGRMVPDFENAAFSLKDGETSDLVKSPFGYHIIRVTEHKEETVAPLEPVKPRIRQTILSERARALVEEKLAGMSDAVRRRKSLEEAARDQGLSVQKSAPLERGKPVPPLTSPLLLARVFELKKGEVASEPFAVGTGYAFVALDEIQPVRAAGGYAVIRVLEKKAFDPAAFEKDKPSITTSLREEKKQQLFQAFLEQARQRYPVERNVSALQRAVTG